MSFLGRCTQVQGRGSCPQDQSTNRQGFDNTSVSTSFSLGAMECHGERVTGAAKRRRERRLRSWSKHERQTVAMALAEALHHSAPRRPKTARAGVPWAAEGDGARVVRCPTGTEASVSRGAVANHACAGWRGRLPLRRRRRRR